LRQFRILKLVDGTRLLSRCFAGSLVGPTALLPLLLLKIRSVRMLDLLDTTVCSEPLVWLFCPA
jgi:hypothetical protein